MTYGEMEYRVNKADEIFTFAKDIYTPKKLKYFFKDDPKTDQPYFRGHFVKTALVLHKAKGWQRYTKHYARQSYRNAAR